MNVDDARSLLDRVLHRIAPEVNLDAIDPNAELQEDLDLDSMDFLNLVTAVHDETGIDVPERDYPRVSTIEGFVTYLVAAAGEGGADAQPSRRADDVPRSSRRQE